MLVSFISVVQQNIDLSTGKQTICIFHVRFWWIRSSEHWMSATGILCSLFVAHTMLYQSLWYVTKLAWVLFNQCIHMILLVVFLPFLYLHKKRQNFKRKSHSIGMACFFSLCLQDQIEWAYTISIYYFHRLYVSCHCDAHIYCMQNVQLFAIKLTRQIIQ